MTQADFGITLLMFLITLSFTLFVFFVPNRREKKVAQTYKLYKVRDKLIFLIAQEKMEIPHLPEQLPHLEKIEGEIVGVGFAPGTPEVRIQQEDGSTVQLKGTDEQVATALAFRGKPIVAMGLVGEKKRLLWIRLRDNPAPSLSYEQAVEYIDKRWGGLLKRLAQ